ncbi:MAG: glycosyltransferase family 4 protein [Muribaculaceae bacterium]|nr:glycosyltransferase family 4 protein [Muribaculaceae bacterium]
MIIGFDGKMAVSDNKELGNFSRLIIDVLSQYYPKNHYMVYAPQARENRDLTPLLARTSVHLKTPRHALSTTLWRNRGGILNDAEHHHTRLFHGIAGVLPSKMSSYTIPSVVSIFDLTYLHYPKNFNFFDRMRYHAKTRRSCQVAKRVIAVSEYAKRDIVDNYGVSADKVCVAYPGVDERYLREINDKELNDVKRKYGLPEKFIVSAGRIVRHRNALQALQALEQLGDKAIKLVLLGKSTDYYDEVKNYAAQHKMSNQITHISRASAADLPAIYHLALACVMPSRYESFAMPIIEAQCCGTPVVAATGSCMEEVGGDGALYVSPDDVNALADALGRVISDNALRNQLIERGKVNAQRFTRQAMADAIIACYEQALDAK